MVEKDAYLILNELIKRESITGDELAFLIHKSSRSVRSIIKNLNDDLQTYNLNIESGTGFGYKINQSNLDQFKKLIDVLDHQQNDPDHHRILEVFSVLVHQKSYIRIDDLCQRLYLSRAQLKLTLSTLRVEIGKYDLTLKIRPHHGLMIAGDESMIRKAMASFDIDQNLQDLRIIKDILSSCIVNADYLVSDEVLNELVNQVAIQCNRIKIDQIVTISTSTRQSVIHESEYTMAQQISLLLSQLKGIHLPESELIHLTMHLSSKNTIQQRSIHVDKAAFLLVERILKELESDSNYPFTSDLNLQLALTHHMIPLRKRIQYALYLKNPLLNEIKVKLLEAYDLSIKIATAIEEEYGCVLPEDEIAYFALHVNLSLEQNRPHHSKSKILLVCSGTQSVAKHIEYFFRTNFENYIDDLDVCSLQELGSIDLNLYNCIFSTTELPHIKSNVFIIDALLNSNDAKHIKQNLSSLTLKAADYFPKDLFFTHGHYDSKEGAIHHIIEHCRKHISLPLDFEQQVLEREAYSSTEYNDMIAFPHAMMAKTDRTFVSVVILDSPMVWIEGKIRIILLSSIEENPTKELANFYNIISTIITDKTILWQIINNPSYENFIGIVNRLEAAL